jgi:phosphatidylethanolamine-binding protein (PEBP) family uncharacterized protein
VYDDGSVVAGGNEQLISSTQTAPNVSFPTQSGKYYSLLMIDPDNDSRQTHIYRQFIHWFVINIPGMAGGQSVDVNKGFVVSPYMGCAPDAGSGRHRYVFLLYEQQLVIPTEHIKVLGNPKLLGLVANLDDRKNHNITKWYNDNANGQQPTLLAGNFFFAERV